MKTMRERVEAKTHHVPECGCWIFDGSWGHAGHGYIFDNERQCAVRVHRAMWELIVGPIPEGMVLRHKCDTPACWNPAHIELGTQGDNVVDRDSRKRNARGESHGKVRITAEDVRKIRELGAEGSMKRIEIARMFGIPGPHVSNILNGKYWKDV